MMSPLTEGGEHIGLLRIPLASMSAWFLFRASSSELVEGF